MPFRSDGTEGLDTAEKACLVRALLNDVKAEWRLLWSDRIDDKLRAEGIANRNYSLLFVERGTVIVATRDFRPVNFEEIVRLRGVQKVERFVPPHPSVGGWRKFIRVVLNKQTRFRERRESERRRSPKKPLQLKKSGRGWLHYRMEE